MLKNIGKYYSPNFNKQKRNKNKIKFIIIHYTGMKSEKDALERLTKIQSQVSSHYYLKKNGEILMLVPDYYVAWHAGKSSWGKIKYLNNYSIGIEISNPGHDYGYKKFTKKQINSLITFLKILIKKYKINPKNILGHSDVAPERKKDPGEKFPWKILASKQISIWHDHNEKFLKKIRKVKCNKFESKKFVENLIKIGYQKCRNSSAIKAFQMRF